VARDDHVRVIMRWMSMEGPSSVNVSKKERISEQWSVWKLSLSLSDVECGESVSSRLGLDQ
jgi:hypothetical protein